MIDVVINAVITILLLILVASILIMFAGLLFPESVTAAGKKIDESVKRWIEGEQP